MKIWTNEKMRKTRKSHHKTRRKQPDGPNIIFFSTSWITLMHFMDSGHLLSLSSFTCMLWHFY